MDKIRIRVDSCLNLIHEVSDRLAKEDVHPGIVDQLQKLDRLLSVLDHGEVSERDLDRIERATNSLMNELAVLFDHRGLDMELADTRH